MLTSAMATMRINPPDLLSEVTLTVKETKAMAKKEAIRQKRGRDRLIAVGPFRQLKGGDWIRFIDEFLRVQSEVKCSDINARTALFLAMGKKESEQVIGILQNSGTELQGLLRLYGEIFYAQGKEQDALVRSFFKPRDATCGNCRVNGHWSTDCIYEQWEGFDKRPEDRTDREWEEHRELLKDAYRFIEATASAERRMWEAKENNRVILESLNLRKPPNGH